MVASHVTYLFNVLEERGVLRVGEDTVTEWSRVALHPSMHQVDEIELLAQQSVDRFLLTILTCLYGLKIKMIEMITNLIIHFLHSKYEKLDLKLRFLNYFLPK